MLEYANYCIVTERRFLVVCRQGWEREGESDKKDGLERDLKKLLEIIETNFIYSLYLIESQSLYDQH